MLNEILFSKSNSTSWNLISKDQAPDGAHSPILQNTTTTNTTIAYLFREIFQQLFGFTKTQNGYAMKTQNQSTYFIITKLPLYAE